MKLLARSFWFMVATAAGAQPAVTNLVLNSREIVIVPVATDQLSIICFPSPISHLEGAYVSQDTEPPARFQVSFKEGTSFFSLRALLTNCTASVNVIWHEKIFVFELVSSKQPWLALTLSEPLIHEPRRASRLPTANRLLWMLDTAKAYDLLQAQHPEEVADVVLVRKNYLQEFGSYDLLLEEVFGFQAEDTLMFRILIHNRSSVPLRYLPQTLRVQVGLKTYYAAITDGNGVVAPSASVTVYFGIASSPDRSTHNLSPRDEFRVLVTLAGYYHTGPVLPAASPAAIAPVQ